MPGATRRLRPRLPSRSLSRPRRRKSPRVWCPHCSRLERARRFGQQLDIDGRKVTAFQCTAGRGVFPFTRRPKTPKPFESIPGGEE